MVQVVSNVTAAELARRLEKEGVVVVSFFAGASCSAIWLLPAASAALLAVAAAVIPLLWRPRLKRCRAVTALPC